MSEYPSLLRTIEEEIIALADDAGWNGVNPERLRDLARKIAVRATKYELGLSGEAVA